MNSFDRQIIAIIMILIVKTAPLSALLLIIYSKPRGVREGRKYKSIKYTTYFISKFRIILYRIVFTFWREACYGLKIHSQMKFTINRITYNIDHRIFIYLYFFYYFFYSI